MARIILAGTYHKTGTVWMENVLRDAAKRANIEFFNISSEHLCKTKKDKHEFIKEAVASDKRAIIFENHTKFPLEGIPLDDVKGFRVIRDPRDIIISAAKYHTWSDESWLHEPKPKFGGKTYQEAINELPSLHERMVFEMTNSSGHTIKDIREFDDHGVFKVLKYEHLIEDVNCTLWRELCLWLGFTGRELLDFQMAFYENSIFGGARTSEHVQSGKKKQYLEIFDEQTKAVFLKHFPFILKKLGYPQFEILEPSQKDES